MPTSETRTHPNSPNLDVEVTVHLPSASKRKANPRPVRHVKRFKDGVLCETGEESGDGAWIQSGDNIKNGHGAKGDHLKQLKDGDFCEGGVRIGDEGVILADGEAMDVVKTGAGVHCEDIVQSVGSLGGGDGVDGTNGIQCKGGVDDWSGGRIVDGVQCEDSAGGNGRSGDDGGRFSSVRCENRVGDRFEDGVRDIDNVKYENESMKEPGVEGGSRIQSGDILGGRGAVPQGNEAAVAGKTEVSFQGNNVGEGNEVKYDSAPKGVSGVHCNDIEVGDQIGCSDGDLLQMDMDGNELILTPSALNVNMNKCTKGENVGNKLEVTGVYSNSVNIQYKVETPNTGKKRGQKAGSSGQKRGSTGEKTKTKQSKKKKGQKQPGNGKLL